MPTPTQTGAGSRRPWPSAMSPCHTGWVATSAVDAATPVSLALGTHVPKCTASAVPARRLAASADRPAVASSRRRTVTVTGASTPTANVLRQHAMARAGAAAYAMSGADGEIAKTATASAANVGTVTEGAKVRYR